MPDELKRDLLLIASKLRPIARQLIQAADQLYEKAPQIQAQIKPTAEKLGSQLEAGAQQVCSAHWPVSIGAGCQLRPSAHCRWLNTSRMGVKSELAYKHSIVQAFKLASQLRS